MNSTEATLSTRELGEAALLDIGSTLYSKERRKGHDDTPVGGIMVDEVQDRDPDTGYPERRYLVVDPWRSTPHGGVVTHWLREAELDAEIIEAPAGDRMRRVARLCAWEFAAKPSSRGTKLRSGILDSRHRELLEWAVRLTRAS